MNNETNETSKTLTIRPPEGYEIDEENSTFACIKFKELTAKNEVKRWEDLENIEGYYVNNNANIFDAKNEITFSENKNICRTKEQAEGLWALSQLSQLYYEFTKDDDIEHNEYISVEHVNNEGCIDNSTSDTRAFSFKDRESALTFRSLHIDLLIQASVWY